MSVGWITLHRKIKDHWVFDNPEYFKAWVSILLDVNHDDNKVMIGGELLTCKRGESLNSVETWVRIFGKSWTKSKVRTFFKMLESDSMIATKGMRKTTHLSVCNYDTYQSSSHTDRTEIAHRSHTDRTQIYTNNNVNNYNNENNNKKNTCMTFDNFWNLYEKKGNRKTAKSRFDKIGEDDRKLILESLGRYVKSTPDKKFRKNAEVYINQEAWNDEIMIENEKEKQFDPLEGLSW
jgi:hypothetical protein